MCRSKAKYPKPRKRARARLDGRLPWPQYFCSTASPGDVEKLAHEIGLSAREAVAFADMKHVLELLSPEAAKAVNYKLIRPLQPRH